MRILKYIKLLTLCFVFTSCVEQEGGFAGFIQPKAKKLSLNERMNAAQPIRWEVTKDFTYDTLSQFQKYDLHRPYFDSLNTEPSLVVITVHGGGWALLDKGYLDPILGEFRKENKNITFFNMNHRRSFEEGVTLSEMLDDIDAMIAEVDRRRDELNLSEDIVIYGYSSGGHLALMYSKDRNRRKKVKALAVTAPPVDLTDPKVRNLRDDKNRLLTELLIGATYEEKPEAYVEASPYHRVSKSSLPTIMFYGSQDEVVGIKQGEKMSDILADKGVAHEFVEFPNEGHDLQSAWRDIPEEVIDFLSKR